MNAIQQAYSAYAANNTTLKTDRGVEYEVFAKVTHALKTHKKSQGSSFPELVSALHENQRLWTLLAANVADAENKLPQEVRARIFYLAEFTQHHSRKVLNGQASTDALTDINLAVMRGLSPSEAT